MNEKQKRLIVGISGASGIIYGIRLLEFLKELNVESHLVMSKAASVTAGLETNSAISKINQFSMFITQN